VKKKYTKNIFLSIGSNLGDRLYNVHQCLNLIEEEIGSIEKKSSVYETEAWGNKMQQPFLNMVIEVHSPMMPHQILETINKIESGMGRVRVEKWEPRIIDIDILYFGDEKISSKDLTIPHPLIQSRKFVLIPLAEIAPTFKHPAIHKTNQALLSECSDPSEVILLKG
jgi:2-amino-4-hydroxy-6-hydroxymethyldihydropteridine diphosphokinase